MKIQPVNWGEAARRVAAGELGVVPTDTLYGVVASALQPAAVERVYALRRRELDKPMIVLIGGYKDLVRFQIELTERIQNLLDKVWPGPVSVVLSAPQDELRYLHRGTGSIAFRLPAKPELRRFLETAGPVVAPSANLAGETPVGSAAEAYAVFGDEVVYVDEGTLQNPPSALVDARTDELRVLRPAPGLRLG